MRSAGEWRKTPRYGDENNNESQGKPNGHRFEFGLITCFLPGFDGANDEHGYSKGHHGNVFHPKKSGIPLMDRFIKIVQEVVYNRACEVQP